MRAAEEGPLDARVPSCPEWDVEALVRHMGDVHRWAGTIVRDRVREPLRRDFEGPHDRAGLLGWYREGHAQLIDALERASPDEEFWFWGPAPNALAFWARRQANETAIHCRDAQLARGRITPLSTRDALDALDEWFGLIPQRVKAPVAAGRRLRIRAVDGIGDWLITLGAVIEVAEGGGEADCTVEGAASDLYLWSMNRQGSEQLRVSGDAGLLQLWHDNVRF